MSDTQHETASAEKGDFQEGYVSEKVSNDFKQISFLLWGR